MKVDCSEIIEFLGLDCLNKKDFKITSIKPPNDLNDGCFTLLTRLNEFDEIFKDDLGINTLAIIPYELKEKVKNTSVTFLFSNDVRTDFVKGMHRIMATPFVPKISKSALIKTNISITKNIKIGENVILSGNIEIGEECEIKDNVVINGKVKIGNNVRIKSGTIIGQSGFNYVNDDDGNPLEFIHIGEVEIGNNVDIGACVSIAQGTLGKTIISENVKIDDQSHIAHNVIIGKNTSILAGTVISGSSVIGQNSWLSPNCSIIDHIHIGDNVKIGIGCTIIKSVPDNSVVMERLKYFNIKKR
jgi:UDP-3-O-[3-hydroxymyristoyl] glucosamine N-acyltransferase LpxD